MSERNVDDKKIHPPAEAGPATDTEQNVPGPRWGSPKGASVDADDPAFNVDSERSIEGKRESFDIAADQPHDKADGDKHEPER